MLGLILDTFVLIVLLRVITGDEEDGFLKPGIIALLAGLAMFGASAGAASAGGAAIWVIIGAILVVAVLVALGCFAMLGVDPKNSAVIGGAFAIYKIIFAVALSFMFAAG